MPIALNEYIYCGKNTIPKPKCVEMLDIQEFSRYMKINLNVNHNFCSIFCVLKFLYVTIIFKHWDICSYVRNATPKSICKIFHDSVADDKILCSGKFIIWQVRTKSHTIHCNRYQNKNDMRLLEKLKFFFFSNVCMDGSCRISSKIVLQQIIEIRKYLSLKNSRCFGLFLY